MASDRLVDRLMPVLLALFGYPGVAGLTQVGERRYALGGWLLGASAVLYVGLVLAVVVSHRRRKPDSPPMAVPMKVDTYIDLRGGTLNYGGGTATSNDDMVILPKPESEDDPR